MDSCKRVFLCKASNFRNVQRQLLETEDLKEEILKRESTRQRETCFTLQPSEPWSSLHLAALGRKTRGGERRRKRMEMEVRGSNRGTADKAWLMVQNCIRSNIGVVSRNTTGTQGQTGCAAVCVQPHWLCFLSHWAQWASGDWTGKHAVCTITNTPRWKSNQPWQKHCTHWHGA